MAEFAGADSDVWERIGSELIPTIRRATGLDNDALWMEYTAADGRVVRPSRALESLLGWSPAGELTLEICHPDDVTATVEAWRRLAEGDPVTDGFANRWRTDAGDYRWLVWSPPLTSPGPVGIASCVHVSPRSILYPSLRIEAERRAKRGR